MTAVKPAHSTVAENYPGALKRHLMRLDIEGLRGIAVMAVFAYHLDGDLFSGGYLGVDIFFVISGYLITRALITALDNDTLSLRKFYAGRFRRIAPALLMTIAVTSVVALILFLSPDLIEYADTVISTMLFAQNVYFWQTLNYFASAAQLKPLLHLWSLGVEEQLYLLFPIGLIIIARFRRDLMLHAVLMAMVLSFAFDVYLLRSGAASAAFFLTPARAWQFCAGGVLAIVPSVPVPARYREVIATGGAVLLLFALLGLGIEMPVSVPAGLWAVIGCTVLIVTGAGGSPTLANRLLAGRVLVFLGTISYSIYLLHWPAIAFSHYYLVTAPGFWLKTAIFITVIPLAWLSYRYVETPFRTGGRFAHLTLWLGGTIILALMALALAIRSGDGFPERHNAQAEIIGQAMGSNWRCPYSESLRLDRPYACILEPAEGNYLTADVALIGNSHAQMYAPLVREELIATGRAGFLTPVRNCLPMIAVNPTPSCTETAQINLAFIESLPRLRTVIVAFDWTALDRPLYGATGRLIPDAQKPAQFAAAIEAMVLRFQRKGLEVILTGPLTEPGWLVPSEAGRKLAFGRPIGRPTSRSRSDFNRQFGPIIARLQRMKGLRLLLPHEQQCSARRCYYIRNGRSLFSDETHISESALGLFRPTFDGVLSAKRR